MTSCVKGQAPLLLAVAKAHPLVCKAKLRGADKDLLQCLSECALDILKGNIKLKPSNKARLTKYRQKLQKVAGKRVSLKQKHKIMERHPHFWLLYWHHWFHHWASVLGGGGRWLERGWGWVGGWKGGGWGWGWGWLGGWGWGGGLLLQGVLDKI